MKKKVWQKKQERKLKLVLRLLLAKAYQKATLAYGIGEEVGYCDLFKVSASGKTTHWYIREGKVLDREKWNRIIIAYFRPLIQKWADCAK